MFQATPREDRSGPDPIRALAGLAPWLGWGLALAGVAWGTSRALERIGEAPATAPRLAAIILEAVAIAIATGLAGWAASVACRVAGALVETRDERRAQSDEASAALASRAVAAVERLADVLEGRPRAGSPGEPAHDRMQRLAEIDRALREGCHREAGSLLDEVAVRFPDDPGVFALRERLGNVRRQEWDASLGQIRAARQVNDHARVLQLYRGLEASAEFDRGALERELSRWFLEVIHRRLRGGRIQPDLVELATMVAETFAATVEGASLRASLPTLRRSVGLCPRCAEPYSGTAAACPKCLAGHPGAAETRPAADDAEEGLDPDDVPEAGEASGVGRESGWMFYNEDDRDDPSPPA